MRVGAAVACLLTALACDPVSRGRIISGNEVRPALPIEVAGADGGATLPDGGRGGADAGAGGGGGSADALAGDSLSSDVAPRDTQVADARDTSPLPMVPPPLPVVWLEAGGRTIGSIDVIGKIKVIEDHDGTHRSLETRPTTLNVAMAAHVRGSFSAGLPKKSYSIELRAANGADLAVPVLGMPAGSDWVLYACYADKTCLRNALMFHLGGQMGRWAPRSRFVEVFIDGKYQGLYNWVERIRRGKYRVDIPKPSPDTRNGGDVTGGYIIKHEGAGTLPSEDWRSKEGLMWTYHYPRASDITSPQKKYIQEHMNAFEAAMKGPDWAHPTRGYKAWIDVPSWIDFALAQELSRNWDGYVRSFYLAKQAIANGDHFYAYPLWDFDLAFGNMSLGDSYKTDGWSHVKPTRRAPDNVPYYWDKLWSDTTFRNGLKCRWQTLREGPIAIDAVHDKIDQWVTAIATAQKRDDAKWKTIGKEIQPTYYVGETWPDDVRWLREWIAKRLLWLDENLPGRCG